jgi:lipopolysaccharide transport system ATP-binding protein
MQAMTGKSTPDSTDEEFWALEDISFAIEQGDRVGIIGRNGAGKSTLLKILSRITEPSNGSIRLRGRVASLLEVGTGFHPELTGRENISLNGAILGMSRTDIQRKFDEIVAFAEVEKFLDTPVKRYSSGMYVRLAFAVAAHLEPEILIVDEVLAVGDAQFQKKCLGKMEEVGKSGRTVLFVSHNMSTIQSLCTRCIFLQKGKILADGSTNSVVPLYISDASTSDSFTRPSQDNGKPTIISGKVILNSLVEIKEIQIDLEIFAETKQTIAVDFRLHDIMGGAIGYGDLGTTRSSQLVDMEIGINLVSFMFPVDKLAIGSYIISLDLALPWIEYLDRVENCLCFEIVRPPVEEGGSVLSQSWGYGSVEFPLLRIK